MPNSTKQNGEGVVFATNQRLTFSRQNRAHYQHVHVPKGKLVSCRPGMKKSLAVDAGVRLGACPHFWQVAGDDNAYEWTTHPTGEALLVEIKRTGCIKWMVSV